MSQVFVAGHKGLVGSAFCRRLQSDGVEPLVASRLELDLTDQRAVEAWFSERDVDQVYLAAAKVGGIYKRPVCTAASMAASTTCFSAFGIDTGST